MAACSENHGWPTSRKSYLDTYVKEGIPPPDTRQNLREWIKVSPVVTFPVGHNASGQPLATRLVSEAINGQRSVKDLAASLGREITAALGRG